MDKAKQYIEEDDVPGWLQKSAGEILIHLAACMDLRCRPVCEIGVHHGKLAILLGLLARGRVVGYDLFERQDENIDESGRGSRKQFLGNAIRYGIPRERLSAITANSLELTPSEIRSACGGDPVFFSVDGGHTEECTYNDLCLAADTVAPDGIVLLDDFFNILFPEVSMATMRFMSERSGKLVPFCVGGGKVLFAVDDGHAQKYLDHIAQRRRWRHAYPADTCQFFGCPTMKIVNYRPANTPRQFLVQTRLWRRVRDTRAGKAIRWAVRLGQQE